MITQKVSRKTMDITEWYPMEIYKMNNMGANYSTIASWPSKISPWIGPRPKIWHLLFQNQNTVTEMVIEKLRYQIITNHESGDNHGNSRNPKRNYSDKIKAHNKWTKNSSAFAWHFKRKGVGPTSFAIFNTRKAQITITIHDAPPKIQEKLQNQPQKTILKFWKIIFL